MWQELLSAVALFLVLEGILPFLNPRGFKEMLQVMQEMDDNALRWTGLSTMLAGVILLYFVR